MPLDLVALPPVKMAALFDEPSLACRGVVRRGAAGAEPERTWVRSVGTSSFSLLL